MIVNWTLFETAFSMATLAASLLLWLLNIAS